MFFVLFLPLISAGLRPDALHAAELRAGQRVRISAGQVLSENLYAAASEVEMAGTVEGDLIAAGGRLSVPGTVTEDITMAGGELQLPGRVLGDVRMAGGQITVGGEILGDLVVAGGTVRVLSGAVIGGEVLMAGGELRIDGVVRGALNAAGNLTRIEGTIQGPAKIRTTVLEFGESAELQSELAYFAPQEADIPPTARIAGPIRYEMTAGMDQAWLRARIFDFLRRLGIALFFASFLMSLAAGLLGVTLFPQSTGKLVQHVMDHFGLELLRGFVLFLVMPPVFFLLMVSVIGVPIAVLSGMIHLGFGIVSVIYAGVLAGALLLKNVLHQEEAPTNWRAVLVGVPLLFLLSLIPLLGFLINTTLFLAVFGGIYARFWAMLRREQPPREA